MMTKSSPCSNSRAEIISSSSWRLAGLALCPWETTTAILLAILLLAHLSFNRPLRHFPDGGQVFQILPGSYQFFPGSLQFEQPAAAVLIYINCRWVGKQLFIKADERA